MARILRGDIYWADLNPVRGHEQAGHRPVLVVSHETFNTPSQTPIILAITSREPRAGFPLYSPLPSGLLPKPSWVKITQIRAIAVERLGRKLAHLDEAEVDRMVEGLLDIVGP